MPTNCFSLRANGTMAAGILCDPGNTVPTQLRIGSECFSVAPNGPKLRNGFIYETQPHGRTLATKGGYTNAIVFVDVRHLDFHDVGKYLGDIPFAWPGIETIGPVHSLVQIRGRSHGEQKQLVSIEPGFPFFVCDHRKYYITFKWDGSQFASWGTTCNEFAPALVARARISTKRSTTNWTRSALEAMDVCDQHWPADLAARLRR